MNHIKIDDESEVTELKQQLEKERMIHLLEARQKHSVDEYDEWIAHLPEQLKKQCSDSLLVQRGRALNSEKKVLEAMFQVIQYLEENPTSVEAQIQYEQLLEALNESFKSMVYLYPGNLELPRIYDVLIHNGRHIDPRTHCDYIKLLVTSGKHSEALDIFLRLSKLYPRSSQLSKLGFELWEQTKHPELARFALENGNESFRPPHVYFRNKSLTAEQCASVLTVIRVIEMTLDNHPSLESLIKLIESHTGTEEHIYFMQLKPLYLKKALILERMGERLKSFELLLALTLMDPADLTLEICLRTAILGVFYDIEVNIIKDSKYRRILARFADQVSQFGFLPPKILAQLSLHDYHEGQSNNKAKERMNALMDTNPLNLGYVEHAFLVARVVEWPSWKEELAWRIRKIQVVRPWDIGSRILLESLI